MPRAVEEYIREARQSILELRSQQLRNRNLVSALRHAGEHLTGGGDIHFELEVIGEPRTSSRRVEDELLRIGQEAINNAARHANPSLIRVVVTYTAESIGLQISDDGCGFDHGLLVEAAGDHYGLISMRERAEEIGGSLEITSRRNHGTDIRALVPLAA